MQRIICAHPAPEGRRGNAASLALKSVWRRALFANSGDAVNDDVDDEVGVLTNQLGMNRADAIDGQHSVSAGQEMEGRPDDD